MGGVLQTNNIHIAVANPGAVTETLGRLNSSPATAKAKAKFVLATDGDTFEAEDIESGETQLPTDSIKARFGNVQSSTFSYPTTRPHRCFDVKRQVRGGRRR